MFPAVVLLMAFAQVQAPPQAIYSLPVDCSVVVAPEARNRSQTQFKAGQAAVLASKWPEAEAALLKAVASDPLLALAHYGLGQTYMAQKRFKEAVGAFSTSRQAFGCNGWTEEELKHRADEIRELREAIRESDQRRLMEILVKQKEVNGDTRTVGHKILTAQAAQDHLYVLEKSLKETNPAPIEVTLALGTALFQINRIEEAEVEFRAVLRRDPHSGDAHHNLALVCAITDRLDEAEGEVAAAEKAGVPIHPRLREEIARRRQLKPR